MRHLPGYMGLWRANGFGCKRIAAPRKTTSLPRHQNAFPHAPESVLVSLARARTGLPDTAFALCYSLHARQARPALQKETFRA